MKTTQFNLRRIIKEELSRVISEGCGCGCGGLGGCSSNEEPKIGYEVEWQSDDDGFSEYTLSGGGDHNPDCKDPYCDHPSHSHHQHGHNKDDDTFSKSEALELVAKIAQMTTCPVTQQALMDIVEDLGESEPGPGWNLGALGEGWRGEKTMRGYQHGETDEEFYNRIYPQPEPQRDEDGNIIGDEYEPHEGPYIREEHEG